jgi:hypothetical protein
MRKLANFWTGFTILQSHWQYKWFSFIVIFTVLKSIIQWFLVYFQNYTNTLSPLKTVLTFPEGTLGDLGPPSRPCSFSYRSVTHRNLLCIDLLSIILCYHHCHSEDQVSHTDPHPNHSEDQISHTDPHPNQSSLAYWVVFFISSSLP